MVLDVTYTFEDYAEANTAHAAPAQSRRRSRVALIGWVVFIALAVALFTLLRRAGRPTLSGQGTGSLPPPAVPTASLANLFLPLVPWLLVFALIWIFVFRLLRAVNKTHQSFLLAPGSGRPDPALGPPSGAAVRSALTWVFVITAVIASLVLMLLNSLSSETDGGSARRSPVLGAMLTALPWFLIAAAFVALVRRAGLGVRRMWEGQSHLQRPKRIEIAEPGVVVSDGVSRLEQLWPSFSHARETKNLFLLYVSDYSFHMIPKRFFAATANADAFRELVRRMIVDRPGPAFPVLPAAAVAQPVGNAPSPAHSYRPL